MPKYKKFYSTCRLLLIPLVYLFLTLDVIIAGEGISTYYIRYDVKFSNNKIFNENLLMVPAENDFRAEKFSRILKTGAIPALSGESKKKIEERIKNNFLKNILMDKGLKSVKTKDYDTVISYEGIIIPPLNILKNNYNEDQKIYVYKAQIKFCSIAFPDKWENLFMRNKIKHIISDFFQLSK